jgi:hypothetical protein
MFQVTNNGLHVQSDQPVSLRLRGGSEWKWGKKSGARDSQLERVVKSRFERFDVVESGVDDFEAVVSVFWEGLFCSRHPMSERERERNGGVRGSDCRLASSDSRL